MREGFWIKNRQRLTLPGFTLVPSARVGLTALFEMGRGDPHRYSHLKTCPSSFGCTGLNIVDMIDERVLVISKSLRAHSIVS